MAMIGEDGLGYEIWLNEPESVEERRQKFLSQMGISEEAGSGCNNGGLELLQRVSQSSDAEMSSMSSDAADGDAVCLGRESASEANSMADDMEEEVSTTSEEVKSKKMKSWWSWKKLMSKNKEVYGVSSKVNRLAKVKCNRKKYMELTGLLVGQEIQAHNGIIWTMKFSPDGQYLATGGEDGVVRIWRVGTTADRSANSFTDLSEFGTKKSGCSSSTSSIVVPERVFSIDELPVHEFHGHSSDVLDLAWSSSNMLLSSSKDKTVRLWRVGNDHCLNVFRHGNYVTCVQFNPMKEDHFISGSIDGKVRIWGVYEARVIDWTDVRDVISAVCYRPDGKEFVVGSIRGTCRFYDISSKDMQLEAEVHIQGRKRSSSNRITGIQFSQEKSPKVMITSEDSKVRIFDGFDLVHKFKGLPRSGSQMSANFTSTGEHVISVGEDCQVYVFSYHSHHHNANLFSSKHVKSEQSFEHFSSQGVSVAVPWPGTTSITRSSNTSNSISSSSGDDHVTSFNGGQHQKLFSLGNWCQFMDKGNMAATWPEERLPEEEDGGGGGEAWGMVIVTASCDGKITSFNNYGLPMLL
ncbi:Uncharacterized WD repeat-containing protein C3H5.08c [Linum perenne]